MIDECAQGDIRVKALLIPAMTDARRLCVSVPRRALIIVIHLYRLTLSPFIGNQCRFYPTCSHYAEQAIEEQGVCRGVVLALRRLSRCHPFNPGGFDPVPGCQHGQEALGDADVTD